MEGFKEQSSKRGGQERCAASSDRRAMSAERTMARLALRFQFLERVLSSPQRASRTQWLRISQPPQCPRMRLAKALAQPGNRLLR